MVPVPVLVKPTPAVTLVTVPTLSVAVVAKANALSLVLETDINPVAERAIGSSVPSEPFKLILVVPVGTSTVYVVFVSVPPATLYTASVAPF